MGNTARTVDQRHPSRSARWRPTHPKEMIVATDQSDVLALVTRFVERSGRDANGLDETTPLYGGGLGLDSLEAAELSATLEDELGSDPFSTGDAMPQTVGEILAFYEAAARS